MRRQAPLALACLMILVVLTSPALAQEYCTPAYCFPSIIDDDAPGDPGPGDPTVSDPLENGSEEHPFDSIQKAIDILANPCSVFLMPGTYVDALQTPGLGCDIVGSGKGVTILQASSASLLTADLYPASAGVLTVRDLTLKNGFIEVFGDETASVTFENVDMQGVSADIHAGGSQYPPPPGMLEISLRLIDIDSGGFFLASSGGPFHATIESVTGGGFTLIGSGVPYQATFQSVATNGSIDLQSYSTEATVDLNQVSVAKVSLQRGGGGQQTLSIRDSTLGELSSQSPGYRFRGTLQNVHFTGRGITVSEPLMQLSVEDCTFDWGGMDITAANSPDVGTGVEVSVARAVFNDKGIKFSAIVSNSFFLFTQHKSFLTVDASSFAGEGLQASVSVGEINQDLGTETKVTVTNSTFDSTTAGAKVTFSLPDFDPDPASGHGTFESSFVNNTFHGSQDGIVVDTDPHFPGIHTLKTLIQNNVIVGGARGISILGTDDHQVTVISNDVYGNSEADYVGDLADQTGLNGNISADPFLADPAQHDLRLTTGSPCIDTGAAGALVPSLDHDGQTRPIDGDGSGTAEVDMGAYEFAQADEDGDGYFAGDDCNDTNADVHPGGTDLPGNVLDEDCSGAAVCSPASFYKTHGMYVNCVSKECDLLVTAGLVSQAECDALTGEAGRSNVGRRQRLRQPPAPSEP